MILTNDIYSRRQPIDDQQSIDELTAARAEREPPAPWREVLGAAFDGAAWSELSLEPLLDRIESRP